jgi:hypothetical protein
MPGEDVVVALIAVAHLAQADDAGHVLQFAIAVGRAGQAVERVVGDVELHHPAAQLLEPLGLGVDDHAGRHRRGAGGRRAAPALDLDQAQPAGAEGLEAVGGAQLGDGDAGLGGRAHHEVPAGTVTVEAVDGQRDLLLGPGGGACRSRFPE